MERYLGLDKKQIGETRTSFTVVGAGSLINIYGT